MVPRPATGHVACLLKTQIPDAPAPNCGKSESQGGIWGPDVAANFRFGSKRLGESAGWKTTQDGLKIAYGARSRVWTISLSTHREHGPQQARPPALTAASDVDDKAPIDDSAASQLLRRRHRVDGLLAF